MNNNKTKVRYSVLYSDKNYEYVLHSSKRLFLKNIADVLNVIEYCVTQDLKKVLCEPNVVLDKQFRGMYNFNIVRLVNDEQDNEFNSDKFKDIVSKLVDQMITDSIQRNKQA